MEKSEAQINIKKLNEESSSLYQSALITLFELDLGALADSRNISIADSGRIFRFHNNAKLGNSDITFQGNKYILAPIETEGYEISSQGVLPTPTLRMSVIEAASPLFAVIKQQIRLFGDLIGCKITRRRTFAKFLNFSNFDSSNTPDNLDSNDLIEFTPDIYYINRKTKENKLVVEYELVSSLELEGIMVPRRLIISRKCNFTYRGEGCNYEFDAHRKPQDEIDDIHGESTTLPKQAPPIATDNDELIIDKIEWLTGERNITTIGSYNAQSTYNQGQAVFLSRDGVNYYFVAKTNNVQAAPPNPTYWIPDKCSKCLLGCKLRWGKISPVGSVVVGDPGVDGKSKIIKGELPYGGFFGTERLRGRGY